MKGIYLTATFLLLAGITALAQHQEIIEKPGMWKGKQVNSIDSTSLLHAFKSGTMNGHFRYFFMATDNKGGLKDYSAHAAGGGIRYETARFHGFQFAASGFFIFNVGSTDLGKPDPTTSQSNRYEVALFDVEDPGNKDDIDRLEELYIKYSSKKASITLGKQLINTPFINLQDGRMRPTGVEAVWIDINPFKNIRFNGGWVYGISPRGTTRWFNIGESIGVYPTGVNVDGTKSGYANNLSGKSILMLGVHADLYEKITVHGWNMFTENIFNTAMLQVDGSFPLKNKSKIIASMQAIRQDAVNNGGHADPAKTYFSKNGQSFTFGTKLGWKNNRWETSLNYNRITAKGRYLVPREWGRDPFFTFMPRERNDGLGDVHAFVLQSSVKWPKARLITSLSAGYFNLPGVTNYFLNKNGLPSYYQVNTDIRYHFTGMLQGLEAQFLLAGKFRQGEAYGNPKYIFNKVDMFNYNFVLNYHF